MCTGAWDVGAFDVLEASACFGSEYYKLRFVARFRALRRGQGRMFIMASAMSKPSLMLMYAMPSPERHREGGARQLTTYAQHAMLGCRRPSFKLTLKTRFRREPTHIPSVHTRLPSQVLPSEHRSEPRNKLASGKKTHVLYTQPQSIHSASLSLPAIH